MIIRAMNLSAFAVVLVAFLAAWSAAAQNTGETPTSLAGVTVVDADQAKALIAKGAKVFDVRKKASFADGHIPGAVHAASAYNKDSQAFDASVFGADKQAAIVIHGHGTDGWTAYHGAKAAAAAGFKKVHWMRSGWAEWSQKGFAAEQ